MSHTYINGYRVTRNGRPAVHGPGSRFGNLILLERYGTWGLFECALCTNVTELKLQTVIYNGKNDCGCVTKQSTERRGDILYWTWAQMIARCEDPNHPSYANYGGRGITVCERWHDFESFTSDLGPRPSDTTLDRVNNDKGYEPSNCKWSTKQEQEQNKRPRQRP